MAHFISKVLSNFLDTGMTEKTNMVAETARGAAATIDQVTDLSDPITREMADNQDKMNFILQNTPKASEDLRQAEDNCKHISDMLILISHFLHYFFFSHFVHTNTTT